MQEPRSKIRRYVKDLETKINLIDVAASSDIEVIAHDESKLAEIVQNAARKASGYYVWITIGRGASQLSAGTFASGPLLEPQRFVVEVWSNPTTANVLDPLELTEAIMEAIHGAITPENAQHDDEQADDCDNIYDVIGWDIFPPDTTTNFFRYQINIDTRVPLEGAN